MKAGGCPKCGSDCWTSLWSSPIRRFVALVECDSCSYRWTRRTTWPGVKPQHLEGEDQ